MFAILGNLRLVPVTVGQQHLLRIVKITPSFTVVLEDTRFNNRIHGAGFLAETTENTFGQVDVVARCTPEPSSRGSASMVIAKAGQIASQSLQAMQRSSPFG